MKRRRSLVRRTLWFHATRANAALLSASARSASLVAGTFSAGYIDQDGFLGCRQGIWDLGQFGSMTLAIPHDPPSPSDSSDYVRVQVTQYRDNLLYTSNAIVSLPGATLLS